MLPQPSSPLQPQPLEATGVMAMPEHFTLVCLDARRKFLWARKFMQVTEIPSYVLYCLKQPVVKTVSIQRVVPKERKKAPSASVRQEAVKEAIKEFLDS